jgi:hypothetical protein
MKLLGQINGIKIYSPKSHTYYDQDLNFLPEYIRKKIEHYAKTHQQNNNKNITLKEEPISEHFKVYSARKHKENKFILKGEDFIAFEVSCQIAHLNPLQSKLLLQTIDH